MERDNSTDSRAEITWIASFPRSGNTWLRFLLTHVIEGQIASSDAVSRIIPDLHRQKQIPLKTNRVNLVKTHFPWERTHRGREKTRAAIYLIRHPLDVVVSCANYQCRRQSMSQDQVPGETSKLLETFIETGELGLDPFWQMVGGWPDHGQSWQDQSQFPVHVVRYEYLLAAPIEALASVCRFTGIKANPARLEQATQACIFDSMANMEADETSGRVKGIFMEDLKSPPTLRFLNKGQRDQWQGIISERQRQRLKDKLGPELARFGYEI